jgi:N-acylneuraminate cytidylyltransferase
VSQARVAILPARGGSKRIPRKNIRVFEGKPMLAWPIAAAQECGLFDRIVVSTDDQEVAAVARAHGAETPFFRPAELADDQTGVLAVMRHAIIALGEGIDYACLIYPTAPMLTAAYLHRGYETLADRPDKSFALAVTSFEFPVQRAVRITADGAIDALYPEYRQTRSQDLEPVFHDAGQFCWGRARAWLAGEAMFSPVTLPVVLPRVLVQDIDTPEDWERAELLFRLAKAEEAKGG